MSEPKGSMTVDERMKRLSRKANVVRSRLLRTIDALSARRHQVTNIGEHATELARPAVVAVVGTVALFATAFFFNMERKRRLRGSLSYRVSHAIERLDLVRHPSLARRVFDRVAFTVVALAVTAIARHAFKSILDRRLTGSPPAHLRLPP